MAINILESGGKKKYILVILGFLVACLIVFVVWKYALPKLETNGTESPLGYPDIVINFASLKNQKIKELSLFQNIQPFSGDFGRANPLDSAIR